MNGFDEVELDPDRGSIHWVGEIRGRGVEIKSSLRADEVRLDGGGTEVARGGVGGGSIMDLHLERAETKRGGACGADRRVGWRDDSAGELSHSIHGAEATMTGAP